QTGYFLGLLLGDEAQRHRVHAVAQAGRRRAVVEDVAEVRAAAAALDLDAREAEQVVLLGVDQLLAQRRPEARPAGAGVELGGRREQRVAAGDADVGADALEVLVLAGERALGPLLARHRVLLGGEELLPLGFGPHHLRLAGVEKGVARYVDHR